MFKALTGGTMLYPILGDPIEFVKSPQRLTAKFEELDHNGVCIPMLVPEVALVDVAQGLARVPNVRGLLVTMPHKSTMVKLCATATETARLLGVVSIVRRNEDGSWHGDMLDGLSFVGTLKRAGAKIEGARVLQIGAGAAGSAIAAALLDAGTCELILHDADASRAEALAQLLSQRGRVITGPPDAKGCDVVVNATPMGMSDDDPLPLPADQLDASMFVGDVVAGHGQTQFLGAAQAAGCRTADGSGMVHSGVDLMIRFLLEREKS